MSLSTTLEQAKKLADDACKLGQDQGFEEHDLWDEALAAINRLTQGLCTGSNPLVTYLTEPISQAANFGWNGVLLPSCGAYLLASGSIYLPSERVADRSELRSPTDTVVELMRREKDVNRAANLDRRQAVMMGLIADLSQATVAAMQKLEARKQARSAGGAALRQHLQEAGVTPIR